MNPNRTAAPPVPVPRGVTPSGDGIVVGTGPVDVEAYIDFQCPFRKQFERQLVELGQRVGITDPEFAETIRRGTYLPWPSFVTERATARGVAGTPSVFVRGIPVAARPDIILAAVNRVLA
ncbi:MAG TPA: hypothetical protein VFN75_00225 [Pseudonocardiaceae bacterium]|nr:hypothetical protein [Pseudonocardiaceae bacterium]